MPSIPPRLSTVFTRATSFARTSLQLQHTSKKRWTMSLPKHKPPSHSTLLSNIRRRQYPHCTRPLPLPLPLQTRLATFNAPRPPPPYTPPTTGLLSIFPASCVPYAELIRLDKPTGTTYLFLPCLFSTVLAAPLAVPIIPPATVLSTAALFYAGALIMRGAGCTINDLWDRDLDPKVERTRLRPIARRAVSVRQAVFFLGAQLMAGLSILLCFPTQCLWYGIPSLVLVGTYPLAKRVTNYPQFVLGLTFSWGAVMGFPALGVDLLADPSTMMAAACLYASCVAWTVIYDMIYAYQDIADDAKAGIKSIALAQQTNAKVFMSAVAFVQVGLLTAAGVAVGAGPVYLIGSCGGAAATLGYMIRTVDLGSVEDCWRWFKRGAWFTGGAISVGLLGEYIAQYLGLYRDDQGVQAREATVG